MANNMGISNYNNHNGAQTQQNYTNPQYLCEDNQDRQDVEGLINQISNNCMTNYLERLENENRELGGVTTTRSDNYVKELRRENNDLSSDKEKVNSENTSIFVAQYTKKNENKIKKEELNKNSKIYLDTDDYDTLCEKRDHIIKLINDIKNEPSKAVNLPGYHFMKKVCLDEINFLENNLKLILKKIDSLSTSTSEKDPNNTKLFQ